MPLLGCSAAVRLQSSVAEMVSGRVSLRSHSHDVGSECCTWKQCLKTHIVFEFMSLSVLCARVDNTETDAMRRFHGLRGRGDLHVSSEM